MCNIATGVTTTTATAPPPKSHDSNSNSNNNSKRSNNSTHSNTKATVHINGIAVDHFQQNSDLDEDRASVLAGSGVTCQNSDIQGFISYSSDSSMIELNLKFRKCACNENMINISKENLEQHHQREQRNSESSLAIATSLSSAGGLLGEVATGEVVENEPASAATAITTTPFSKEDLI